MARIPSLVAWPVLLAVLYAVLWYAFSRMAFYPSQFPDGFWALQKQLGAEDVWLHTEDGVRLHGWWIPQAGARFATLFLHGNAGNLTHRYPHMRAIADAGSAVLVIDYRGYGKSSGRPSEKGVYRDAEAGWQHLLRLGFPADRIIIHGESLGTAVAVELASRRPGAGLILEAPFTSGRDVAARVLPLVGPLFVWSFDSRSRITRVHTPLLVIHGNQDEVIPYDLGRALFDAANQPKALWTVHAAGHNDLVEVSGAEYVRRLRAFYQQPR